MVEISGLFWPDDVGTKWRHSLKHVQSLEWAIARCPRRRTAVQAGGNVGLWPKRLAASFERVITFEPDDISRQCLFANVPPTVEIIGAGLGREAADATLERESLGSHHIGAVGNPVRLIPLDVLELDDLDFLQLDVEGYEWHALLGATETLKRCKPLVQVELRDFGVNYGVTDADVCHLLYSFGYMQVSRQPGNDVVFEAV